MSFRRTDGWRQRSHSGWWRIQCATPAVVKSRTKLSLAIGVVLILLSLAVAQCQIASHFGSWNPLLENGF